MRILLATDAWQPQVNGVVTTLNQVVNALRGEGHDVEVVSPADYPTVPLPTYPEIKIAYWLKGLGRRIDQFDPDAIHIATEGPIGQCVRRHCLKNSYTFTTSFHTRFPEYIHQRLPIPLGWTYPPIRRFHRSAFRTLVPTVSLKDDLLKKDFRHLTVWGRGVETELFNPDRKIDLGLPRPVMLNVGRIAPEKNLEAFLSLKVTGSKVIVGDGPQLEEFRKKYPDVLFPGVKKGVELAEYYASADVFVFPSKTDTFGLVMLESLACGTPVAAFPVTGPLDILQQGTTGIMQQDLKEAITQALGLDRPTCREYAEGRGWPAIARQFLKALMPVNGDKSEDVVLAQAGSHLDHPHNSLTDYHTQPGSAERRVFS